MNWYKELDIYCERTSPEFWAEPLNAFSNLFFILAGAYVLHRVLRVTNLNHRAWLIFLSSLVITVGIGSSLFHTFANTWSLYADITPILIFQASYITFILRKPFKAPLLGTIIFVSAFISLTLYLETSFIKSYFNGSVSYFPAWITACFFAQALYPKHMELSNKVYSAVFIFALSLFFRSVDMSFCKEIVSGTHFIWHMLNGVMLFTLLRGAYQYSKIEKESPILNAD